MDIDAPMDRGEPSCISPVSPPHVVGDYEYEQESEVVQKSVWRGWEQFLASKVESPQEQPMRPRYAQGEQPDPDMRHQQVLTTRNVPQHTTMNWPSEAHRWSEHDVSGNMQRVQSNWPTQVQPLHPHTGQSHVGDLNLSPTKRQRML
eukprot:CAMPEP_0115835160 /NCGR_PEP_ID=MMETSP0287-20121206/4054_1 /TAXON_ID=412157 /ORGANISM="Chrysochromulina rotalis, Strain UIO044" /LENGTH=146 /DNA_ID=CAMNT_0003288615 /DNA_START=18 /DNA_END=458 /DNA_ORIENTATION=-